MLQLTLPMGGAWPTRTLRAPRRGRECGRRGDRRGAAYLLVLEGRSVCCELDELGDAPCPLVGCKHHLYLDVNPDTGSIKLNFPDLEVWELKETCSRRAAFRGGHTLEEVGDLLNLTREAVRKIEVKALLKLRRPRGRQ